MTVPHPGALDSARRQSIGAGAAGGAALGSVIALGILSSTILSPLLGAIIGAAGGAGLGHLVHGLTKPRGERDIADIR